MIGFVLFTGGLVGLVWGMSRITRKDRHLRDDDAWGGGYGVGYQRPGEDLKRSWPKWASRRRWR